MSKYRFKKDSNWWTEEEKASVESFLKALSGNYRDAMEQFFSIPQIQEWVNQNRWDEVFREWDDGYRGKSKPGLDIGEEKIYRTWIVDVLALFLALSDIEFMSYLDDSYVEKRFQQVNYEEI